MSRRCQPSPKKSPLRLASPGRLPFKIQNLGASAGFWDQLSSLWTHAPPARPPARPMMAWCPVVALETPPSQVHTTHHTPAHMANGGSGCWARAVPVCVTQLTRCAGSGRSAKTPSHSHSSPAASPHRQAGPAGPAAHQPLVSSIECGVHIPTHSTLSSQVAQALVVLQKYMGLWVYSSEYCTASRQPLCACVCLPSPGSPMCVAL